MLNEKDTEECINDTWLKVWDSIPPIIPEILSAFIGKITRNQAINKYKYENASKRVNSRIEKTLDELNECEILLNNNVSEEMDRKELEAKIIELVAMSYNKDASELSVDTKIKEELGGASLLMVGLVSEIENELDVLIQLQVAAACATIGELVDKVEEQM